MKKSLLVIFGAISLISLSSCSPTSVAFVIDEIGTNAEIHSTIQLERFINNPEVVEDTYLTYLNGLNYKNDYSSCEPIKITYKVSPDKGKIKSYSVTVSKNSDMSDAYTFTSNATEGLFYNAEIDTTYYYYVSADSFKSEIASFKTTSQGPRNCKVDGLINVRDIAYYKIKQGLIYRGPSFETFDDDSQKVITNITNKGKSTIKSQLKIKTEVDLRKNVTSSDPVPENCNITKSAIDGVTLKALPMYYGGQNILTYVGSGYDNPARIKDFFNILGEKDNYPIYVHCSQGKDRTGCLAYLLQALLGEDEDTRYRDYLFSNLANTTYNMKTTGISGTYGKTLSQYKTDGETFMEATYRYLNKVIGVSTSTLDAVINLLKA